MISQQKNQRSAWRRLAKRLAARRRHSAFTLMELLLVVVIIAIISAALVVALASAQEDARDARTRAQITKIQELIEARYLEFETRTIPFDLRGHPDFTRPQGKGPAVVKLKAIRELMRMELPDRITDLQDPPVYLPRSTSLWRAYRRRVAASGGFGTWTRQFQGAECLYMILSLMQDENGSALDHFGASEIGDVDGDNMPEILDAWGMPIEFLRWPTGFVPPNSITELNDPNTRDPFDPFDVDQRAAPAIPTFSIFPLIYSAGPDKNYDVVSDAPASDPPHQYSQTVPPNDPFSPVTTTPITLYMGTEVDADGDGDEEFGDNIYNHRRDD